MRYFITTDGAVGRLDPDGRMWWIPPDLSNKDYVAYQEWLAEGNAPQPWPPAES